MVQQSPPHHQFHKSFPAQTPLVNQPGMLINSQAVNDTQYYWLMLMRTPAYGCKLHRSLLLYTMLYAHIQMIVSINKGNWGTLGKKLGTVNACHIVE